MPDGAGGLETRREFALRRTKTSRVISDPTPEHYTVAGHVDSDGYTDVLSVSAPVTEPTTVERLIATLDGARLGRSAVAKALDLNATGTKFRDALAEAVDGGLIVKGDDGLYGVPA